MNKNLKQNKLIESQINSKKMQSPTNKTNRSFTGIFPSIHKPKPNQYHSNHKYELNNEGCRCLLCQKIIINQNMKVLSQKVNDHESELFSEDTSKQFYIELLNEIVQKWKFKRNLRFCLPEVCLFRHGHPYALIEKKKQAFPITINKSKSRLHFFQIQNFFLTGYILHSPIKKNRESKNQALSKPYINQCIVFAKYDGNCYRMLTYKQIQAMFRSKNRSMKDGLMYLQTIVGADSFKYRTVIVRLDDIENDSEMNKLFQRAKLQVQIIAAEIKPTDSEYFSENEELEFQNQLKDFDVNRYLLYLSYKIILTSSKLDPKIMKNVIFKFTVIEKKVFLFDLRVKQFGSGHKYWSSNLSQAFQKKLKKTMSIMQMQKDEKQRQNFIDNQLSSKARQLSEWLKASTEQEWEQMRIIRKRLEKLQEEKRSLDKSKKQQQQRKNFKIKNMPDRKQKQRFLLNNSSSL